MLGLEVLIIADLIQTTVVDQTLESVAVLGIIVAIRVVLSFSLEVETDGMWPWNGGTSKPTDPRPRDPDAVTVSERVTADDERTDELRNYWWVLYDEDRGVATRRRRRLSNSSASTRPAEIPRRRGIRWFFAVNPGHRTLALASTSFDPGRSRRAPIST